MSQMSDYLSQRLGSSADWHNYSEKRFPNAGIDYNSQNWASVVADALAAGTGAFAETGAHLANDLTGNKEGDPMGWNAIADWGKATRERNTHDYMPGSGRYYMSTMAQAVPEMGADMLASMGVGAAAGAALGPQAAAAGSVLKGLATAGKWGKRALDFYNSEKKLAKAAKFLTPSMAAETVPAWAAATATGMGLEGAFEGQRAMDDYIEEAKRNGTYVPGQTEDEARNLRWNVFKDNQLLLGGTNALENLMIFGKGKGLMNGLKRLGIASGIEGFEEGAQQIIPKAEQGKPWSVTDRDVLESAAIGAVMGGGMHLAGRGIRHAFPNAFGDSYDTEVTNPMTNPNRTAERDNDVPLPGNIDYTEADPSDIVNDWLNKQTGFGNVNTNVDTPQAQQGQTSSLPQSVEVSGENSLDGFDKRFVSKWESKAGATDLAGVQKSVKAAFNAAIAEYGDNVTITGGAEKGYHAAGETGHEGGWKIDVDKASVKDPQKFLQAMARHGFQVGDEGDHFDLSGHAKGGVGGTVVATPDSFISDGEQSSQATGKREGHANAWAIADVFRKAGYNDEAIAGILGRVQQEHNFDTSDVPEHEEEGMHVGGYGMFQWNGGRTTAFLSWAKQSGKDPQNPTTQAEYALYEAQQKGLTPDKMNKLSAEDAADLWTSDWEVGRPGSERQYAGEWRERLKKGGTAPTISTQDFGNILGNHMIDFAGSEDDNLTNSYQRIMDNLDNDTKSILSNKFANMYNDDGTFNNTAENRQALAQDEQTAELIRSMAEVAVPQIVAPMVDKNGRISKQAVKDYFTPQIAGVNMHFLKDAIKNDKLNDAEKVAVLQAANIQINIPQSQKTDTEQAKYVNDLQKAIDSRDFGKIYSLMPNETAKAVAGVRQSESTAQPAMAVVTPEQAPVQEQASSPVEQPQEVPQAQPVEQYNPDTAQNAPQPVQGTPAPQGLPSVPTEQENAQTAQQVANKAQQIANVQGQDFNTRLAELQAMPLGQLEQLGQQTLNVMQAAGLPVNKALANGLTAGKENAIALAESRLAEAGVNPIGSNQEQVQSKKKSNRSYQEVQNEIDKLEDELIKKYGDDALFFWKFTPENDPVPQAERQRLLDLYEERDSIQEDEDEAYIEETLKRLKNYDPLPREGVRELLKKIVHESNLYNAMGHKDVSEKKDFVKEVYTTAANWLHYEKYSLKNYQQYPADFIDFEYALRVANKENAGGRSPYGVSPKPLLRQANDIVNAMFGIQQDSEPINVTDISSDTAGNVSTIDALPQGKTQAKSKQESASVVTNYRDDAVKVINQYRDDKITFEEAQAKLEDMANKAANKAKDNNTKAALWDTFAKAATFLEGFRQQKAAAPQKLDYANMSLDELKAERQRLIDEEVDRMNRNPGGKGVNVGYTQNERGEINGRYAESNNPDWYQKSYKKLGRKPKVSEYQDIATDNLKEIEEFARLEDAIARLEQEESAKNAPTPKQDKASENREVKPAKSEVEPENVNSNEGKSSVLKDVEGLWESTIEDYIDRGFGIESYKGHKDGKKLLYDLTFESEAERKRFMDDFYGESEEYEDITEEDYKAEEQQEEAASEGSSTPETTNQEKDYDFGDLDENFADLANSLGITPVEQEKAEPKAKSTTKDSKGKPKKKKRNLGFDDSDEALEAAKKELKEALKKSRSRMNAMPVFDVDVIVPMMKVGAIYVQRGAETFADYAREMISSIGEEVRDWLHPVWKMIENYPEGKKFDESQVIPMFRYVGSYMRNHKQATFDEVKADFAKRAGKENAEKFNDLLVVGYQGAYNCFNGNEEVTDNELNDSTRQNPARDSEGNNQDEVGAVHGDGESVSRGGQGVQQTGKDSRSQRSGSVHGRSSSRSGETSDSGVQGSESGRGNRDDSTGGKQLTGSRRDSYDRPAVDEQRNAESFGTAKNRPIDGGNRGSQTETVKVNKDSFKAGDREQIASSMPFLMKEQVDDVVKADTRLYTNNGEGMMFTNGTGTGKTFTGLGCVKRAVQQGKKNILIIAPTDKVQNDWITTGKGFFGLDISKLENTTDAGEGIVITSYENVGANNKLVKRDWDMIVTDESHKLMQGEKGSRTKALENVRAMTYHADGLRERFERLHAKEYDRLAELRGKASDKEHPITAAEKQELEKLQAKLIKEQEKAVAEWKQIPQADKPKVLFLSATPFSYVPDIDYAEGYLFHYDRRKNQNGGYNQPNAYDDFMIKHFGYRMRVGKLTKPDADVNSDLMEINFNNWLKNQGVLSGRKLKVTPDYERGYILVDGGVGKQIDEGMKIATERGVSDSDQKYGKLHDLFENKLKGNKTRYLLEAIKAKEAVDLINQYVKGNKKVVVFHDFKKNEAENPFVLTDEDFEYMDEVDRNTARQQYARFCKDHPELLNLNLDDLQSPIERFTEEFGDSLRIFNGDIPKKKRENAVREFQDDNSKVKIILCQRASAKEGISMHDTTGKHQRVLIDLGLATRPTDLIQGEGRIYRTGVITDAIIRYLNTGTDMEKRAFASTIAGRASTAENLSMGEDARALRNAIVEGFMESLDGDSWKKYLPGSATEGKGGKERDSKLMDGVSPYEAAKSDYFANQKKNSWNKAQEGIDYFPTPEPIGFKMVEWLGLKPGDRVLEPSAGHGAISRYFGAETRNTIVEPSSELATLAKMRLNGGSTAKVIEGRFEDLDIHNKYEGIVMNPPYGVGGKTAYEHVAKAFDHLADGGRLIAIVPDGPAANKRLENWLNGDGTKANPGQSNAALLSEIKLPQVTFNRAGTSVATKILIIDKYNDPADLVEMERRQIEEGIDSLDLTGINDINELFDKLEYVRTPERVGSSIPRHFTNSTNKKGNPSRKYITLPDDTKLLDDTRLRELAYNNRGTRDMRGGWYEFFNENDRAKFVKAANKYLAGKETLAAEQQEIVDEVLTPNETEHFKGGEFTNSDGVAKPQAAIKGNLHRDLYLKVKEIAQQNNGSYSKGARGFVFDNAADRDNFLKKAEAFFLEKASYSAAPGKIMTTDELNKLWNDTAEVVSEDKLTAQEKELRSMAQSMGVQLEFVTCSPRIQGKYDPVTGISYINRNAAHNSAPWVAWHEMFHWIKRNNETLFNKLVEHIKTKAPFSKAQLDKYREAIGRPDISDEVVIEEMMADAFPDVRKRVPFFRELARENVSLYKRLVAFVKRVMDNIVSRFRAASMAGRGLDFQQIAEMHNAFCNMVRDIRGADGKPIFKVSKDGYREIADMDGNTTEQILEAYSLAEAENNLDDVKYSLDNSETLTDNERRALGKVKDSMSFEDVRELFLAEENHEVGKALQVYNLRVRRHGKDSAEVTIAKDALGEAYQDATAKRREFTTEENVSNLARLLRSQNKAREGGYLAKDLQRVIDARRNGNTNELTQIPGEYRSMYNQIEEILGIKQGQYSIAPKHSDNQGAFSVAPVEAPGSMERIKNATRKLLGLQEKLEDNVQDRHTEKQNQKNSLDDTLPLTAMVHSMKYLAGKNEAIKRIYYLAKRCMDEQEHLRNEFKEVIRKINTLMADKADRESLHALLLAGDADGKEYTAEELQQEGFSDNVIAAYKLVRDNLAKAYQLVNDARMQVKVRNKTIKASELPEFMKENFIDNGDIINTQDVGGGKIIVTYRGAKVYENRTDIVNDDMLKAMEADENIVITEKNELGKGVYNITYNEKPQPLGKLTGYMPHFFHRFMVYAKTKDEAGNDMRVAIGSAKSLADATKIANEVAKHNPDKQFVIDTHSFEYGDENNGVVVGDLNYQEMTKRLAENTEMSLTEANKFLHDSAGATLKSRHRFFGNMMKRTGVQGFDENMMWALTHYFNSAARYVAMEHFKPDAISWYERFFGDFNADPKTIKGQNKRKTAQIIRDYINDVNGTPREIEKWCNEVVDRIPIIGEKLNDTYNGRPALALSSKVSWFNAVTKLGCLSISSPMLNFMQFINVATMLDSVKYAKMGLNKALKPSELDNLILDRSGIMDEINLASDAGGYTQSRDYGGVHKGLGKGKALLDKSMFFFTWCDALMRKAAVLGAYYQGVQEKGMKPDNGQQISAQALEYAREVNSEANFDYSAANTPEAIRMGSVITQQAFQFQKYPIMQFEFFWNHVVHGTNTQRVKFLMPYFLLTGLPGMIPFGELLAGMLGLLIPGDDDDFAKKMKAELMRWAGDDSAKQAVVNSLTNGPLAAFTGIDISERAGMQNFFAGRYYGSKPESTPGAIGTLLGGAAYSTVSGVQNQLRNGNPIEAIKAVSPGLGNWLQAAVGETRTTHHRVGSTYDSMYERILHGMGFRHIDETNTQFINSYLYESSQRQKEDKKFIMDAYLDDPSEENKEQLVFWGISDKQLKQYKENREKSSRDRAAGDDETKKKSKKPKTEAQLEDDKLRAFMR